MSLDLKALKESAAAYSGFEDDMPMDAGTVLALIALAEQQHKALVECHEYFDQRADADCVGDPPRFVGNRELNALGRIDAVLAAGRAAGLEE